MSFLRSFTHVPHRPIKNWFAQANPTTFALHELQPRPLPLDRNRLDPFPGSLRPYSLFVA
jgi:hypothetical protein